MLRFASLGSGSSGNATVISSDNVNILLDCGFSTKETARRLSRLGLDLGQLSALLVTHEHSDHVKGVPALARKTNLPVYMTRGTSISKDYGHIPQLNVIDGYQSFQIGDIHIRPVAVPHDAREPAQFVFTVGGVKLGVLTDVGSITTHILDAYDQCHGLLLEANHDRAMLATGPYPAFLKERVASPWGHLSNEQAVDLLQQLNISQLQHLVIGHISQKNNSLSLAMQALGRLGGALDNVHYACQEQGFGWLTLQ